MVFFSAVEIGTSFNVRTDESMQRYDFIQNACAVREREFTAAAAQHVE